MAHSAMEILSNIERMVKKGLPTLRIEDVPLDLLHQIAWAAIEVGLLYEDCEIDCDLTENPRVDIALKGLARAAKECLNYSSAPAGEQQRLNAVVGNIFVYVQECQRELSASG